MKIKCLVVMIFTLLLVGCGNTKSLESKNIEEISYVETSYEIISNDETKKEETSADETKQTDSFIDDSDDNNDEVTITIPYVFASELDEKITQKDLDELVQSDDGFIEGTLNDDGSITMVYTKAKQREALEIIEKNIDLTLDLIPNSKQFPNVTDAKANEDYTSFIITTKNEVPDENELFLASSLYWMSYRYAAFSGITLEHIHVDFIKADSGEIISAGEYDGTEYMENK